MRLSEQCEMCKNNWDGHCVMGNDRWKARMADTEIECEEYEESEGEQDGSEIMGNVPINL